MIQHTVLYDLELFTDNLFKHIHLSTLRSSQSTENFTPFKFLSDVTNFVKIQVWQ